jgi:hypothetical protein
MKALNTLYVALVTTVVVLPTNLLANWSNYPFHPAPWVHGGNPWGPDFIGNLIAQILPFV